MGDPAGIGPEVIAKALADKALAKLCQPVVIGSRPIMERTIKWLDLPLEVVTFDSSRRSGLKPGQVVVADPLEKPLPKFRQRTFQWISDSDLTGLQSCTARRIKRHHLQR